MKDVSLLATVPLFTSLDASQIASIAATARRERYERKLNPKFYSD